MATTKKVGKKTKGSLKRTISKKAKRVAKSPKIKKLKSGTLLKIKVTPRFQETINELRQTLNAEISLLQKQEEKANGQLQKAQVRAEKASARFSTAEAKMATKGVDKQKLRTFKSNADKSEKAKASLEKSLSVIQKPLAELKQELEKLIALEKSFKKFNKDWEQPAEDKKAKVAKPTIVEKIFPLERSNEQKDSKENSDAKKYTDHESDQIQ